MVLNTIYKEFYQQVGRSSNNGNEFHDIALILSEKKNSIKLKLNKPIHLKKTAD